MATRIPGMISSKGPKRNPTPGLRPEFIVGSRPENLRAGLPGRALPRGIKPGAASTRDYGKPIAGPAVATSGVGP